MHDSVMENGQRVITKDYIEGKRVLEVGSNNINGSLKQHVTGLGPDEYVGIDLEHGKNVDKVMDAEKLSFPDNYFDFILCTEVLEHVEHWQDAVLEIKRVLKVGGTIYLTTRSTGFGYHNKPDYWRYSVEQIKQMFSDFEIKFCIPDPCPQHPGVFMMASKPEGYAWDRTVTDSIEPSPSR